MKAWHQALAPIALAGAVALGGCGGGSSSDTKTSSSPAATIGPATSTSPSATGTTTTGTSTVPARLRQAVAECHNLIEKDKSLPANAKAKLENACDEAGKGDTDAVKRVAREVCEEVVTKSPLPADSPARKQALETCKKQGG